MGIKVFVEGAVLKGQMVGQPAFDLLAASPTQFSIPAVGAELSFAPEAAHARTLTLK